MSMFDIGDYSRLERELDRAYETIEKQQAEIDELKAEIEWLREEIIGEDI